MSKDLIPVDHSNTDLQDLIPIKEETQFDKDLNTARENMLEIILTGMQGLQEIHSIADSSQNYLAYERLSAMLKTMSDLQKDFVDISRQKRDEEAPKELEEASTTVNNNLFVGSMGELQAMLSQLKKNDENE